MTKRAADSSADLDQIHERLERAYQRIFGGPPGAPNFCAPFTEPPVDVYDTTDEVVVLMEIAGIPDEEVEIEVDGREMVIRGERKPLSGRPQRRYSQMEITHGPFQRTIYLPSEVNPEQATAVYKDGVLEIALPKAAPARGTHVRILVH